jgi:glycosyltransferase involved in cell wall biosynthesis
MKLGYICDPSNNAYYRAINPLRALERRGHEVLWPETLGEDLPMRALVTCDLVHCYRNSERLDDLRRLSARGVAVTFDNDDDYSTAEVSDGGTGLKGKRFNQEIAKAMHKMALQCDLMTTPSPVLADVYRRRGVEKVEVIENHLDRAMFGFGAPSRHDGVVIGWIAGREHRVDAEQIPIVQALEQVLERHDDARLLTLGMRLPLRSDRYEHIESVPYPQLLKVVKRIDIGIAPLADVPFNRSRSNVKLKEYASGGAPWVASGVGPYRGFGEEEGGVLVSDGDWFAALDEIVGSARIRKRLSKRAQRWAKRQAIDSHAERWEKVFQETVARVRG